MGHVLGGVAISSYGRLFRRLNTADDLGKGPNDDYRLSNRGEHVDELNLNTTKDSEKQS